MNLEDLYDTKITNDMKQCIVKPNKNIPDELISINLQVDNNQIKIYFRYF